MASGMIITAEKAAVDVVENTTEFIAASSFILLGEGFTKDQEYAQLYMKWPDNAFRPITLQSGGATLRNCPNAIFVPFPGVFRVFKTVTEQEASVAYVEV